VYGAWFHGFTITGQGSVMKGFCLRAGTHLNWDSACGRVAPKGCNE